MRQAGSIRLKLYDRIGIALVILGMMQSLAPTCFRHLRPSLRMGGRLTIALTLLDIAEASGTQFESNSTLASVSGQDQESDQESQSSEDLVESFSWVEAIPVRRTVQRFASIASLRLAPMPGRASERTRFSVQQSRSNAILASSSACMTALLCRMTC